MTQDDSASSQAIFQSTLLMRGATAVSSAGICLIAQFQSTLLMRGATWRTRSMRFELCKFQSTLLMRGATALDISTATGPSNFNPRSSCEERRLCT